MACVGSIGVDITAKPFVATEGDKQKLSSQLWGWLRRFRHRCPAKACMARSALSLPSLTTTTGKIGFGGCGLSTVTKTQG
eukprot:10322806-Prorocentrum_lima.AAC.1